MRSRALLLAAFLLLGACAAEEQQRKQAPLARVTQSESVSLLPLPASSGAARSLCPPVPEGALAVIAERLSIPWDFAFLPEGDLLVTERAGRLLRIGKDRSVITIAGVEHAGEGGLLGIALHPRFAANRWVYLYLTTRINGALVNRVERHVLEDDALRDRTDIITGIPGGAFHDGGRIAFGPDGLLYVTTGDAGEGDNAQSTSSLAGKILRVTEDGSVPADNPFGNAVYSYGHRNPQGLAWDGGGRLWSTEHGRSGVLSGFDELNLIERGGNYGWPILQGSATGAGMIPPVLHSGPVTTWAPASALARSGSIFFGGLKGKALYEAVLPVSGSGSPVLRIHYAGVFGRIRSIHTGPEGDLYLATSNLDGRGRPEENDDRIIRIPASLLP